MSWVTFLAVFLIVWWVVLFAVLPFGLKTQDEEGDVTLGTVPSAPRGPHVLRAVAWTTLISLAILGLLYWLTRGLGYRIDDLLDLFPKP
jgi:predicted secreted protein